MSELAQRLAGLSPAQRELLERRLAQQPPKPTAEPIAIIGMACRFPGAPNLSAFWKLIDEGMNAAQEVPADRWDPDAFYDPTGETPGKMSVRWAALVDGHDQFDPQFFGITPREAARMDPQQRLLLEVAWEAMENAGRPADQMAGTKTGVYVGIGGTDYSKVCIPYDDYFQHIDAHMGTGNALSIASNRLSYIFDFHGPSASIDTACSSASLAIHFAVESLRRGESDAALAGGVNMILTPETTIAFSKARMLSPQGKCRPFDASADGYVRGEGCGLVLLKRLADAERDGDNILAVIRATSVNQDGRTSGISAPSSRSQIDCIRAAHRQAGLTPRDIDYIEAHGTGTPLGDPIEMQALCEIFRQETPSPTRTTRQSNDQDGSKSPQPPPCYVASVKANIGHMETVSGVAGLIKVVLMLQHEKIARQTHFETLNPHINLAGTRLAIADQPIPWPNDNRPRRAGVSSFGFGGTNTHIVVESAPPQRRDANTTNERPVHVLKLSGKTETALSRQAAQIADYLDENPSADVADICATMNIGRADFNHRATIVADSQEKLREALTKLSTGEPASAGGLKHHTIRALSRPKVAFLCTGQGLQYVNMGRKLYETQPVFRDALDACDKFLRELWNGQSLVEVIFPASGPTDDPQALLHQTQYTQPALFALEVALAQLWRSWGVLPDMLLGHSVGEYAAACIAGAMSLEDGLALIAERARLMQSVQRHGKMAVVMASPDRVTTETNRTNGQVVVAVINGPENTVISGASDAVEALAAEFASAGVQVKLLNVSHAFHSPLMDEMLDAFEHFAARITFHPPRVPLAANLTGKWMSEAPTARYWRNHLRNTVQFAAGMELLSEAAPKLLIEIGPTPSLLSMGRRCVPALDAAWLPSLRQGQDDWQTIASSVAEFYTKGGHIDWRAWDRPWPRKLLPLPNYPFERSRHWYELDPTLRRLALTNGETASAVGPASEASGHPLLGSRLSTVWTNTLYENRLSARAPAYLVDHQVQGSPVTPAAAYVEQGLAAAEQLFGPGRHGLENLVIQQAMFLPEGARRRVQVSVAPEAGGESSFEAYSRPADSDATAAAPNQPWTMHATGRLLHESRFKDTETPTIDLDDVRDDAVSTTTRDDFYQLMAERGLAYGPSFQVLDDLRRSESAAVARIALPDAVLRDAPKYHLHPSLGDALLQSMAGVVPLEADGTFSPFTYMPVGIHRICFLHPITDLAGPWFTFARRTSDDATPSPERVEGDVFLVNEQGEVHVAFEGVAMQRLGKAAALGAETDIRQWLYRVAWKEVPHAALPEIKGAIAGAWLILADQSGTAKRVADALSALGQASLLVSAGHEYACTASSSTNGKQNNAAKATIDPLNETHYRQLFDEAFISRDKPCLGVVDLWPLDIPSAEEDASAWEIARQLGVGCVTQMTRALVRAAFKSSPPVWIVTRGAEAVSLNAASDKDSPIAIEQSPLVGLLRAAAMELPDLRPRLVDLDPADAANDARKSANARQLVRELVAGEGEGEVAFRNDNRYVPRLTRDDDSLSSSSDGDGQVGNLSVPAGKPFQLRITQTGSLDALRYTPVERKPPQPGQIEIEVHAAGLNFSDVLKALGLYPGIRDAIVPLGIEASGVVTAVGNGVDRFHVGDEVFGVVPYAFASHALSAEYAIAPKPKSVSHEAAATIPITFLTAHYALVQLAQMQPGERVLIHAGAGGVGLAAIQIAQHIGAEIFATAGSDEKRDFLRSRGVPHVYSSRTTAFAEEILADTNREGVDIVLNSLPGEAITKSLSLLRAYGRFLEIGKTDIYQNRMIGLLPFQDNLSYFAIDLDRLLRQRPAAIRQLFAEVNALFEAGHYRPLAFTHFAAEDAVGAFRYMSQRKNIGKVVVELQGHKSHATASDAASSGSRPSTLDARPVRPDGAYLITGGLGGLGLRVAKWLAGQGAGAVALLGRRGPSADAEQTLATIRELGTQVHVLHGDVSDRKSLAKALTQLPSNALPLRGVVHAAGALADGLLMDMTLERLDQVMQPKVAGAWNLHELTKDSPLDFFVLFSSVAAVLGSPGQANYAAGNAMLDALAHFRRAAGLPAVSINWGPWAGSGMAASEGRGEAVQSRGMALLNPEQGLEVLDQLLRANTPQTAVMDARWPDMFRLLGNRRPALLTDLAAEVKTDSASDAKGRVDTAFRTRIIESDDQTRHTLICDYIQSELGRIIGVDPRGLEIDQPISTFGLDSLLALELKNNLESRLDFTLPMAKLMEGPSIASLAAETAARVVAPSASSAFGSSTDSHKPEAQAKDSSPDPIWSPLLALRPNGARPPLVLLPPLGGDVRCYAELIQRLDVDVPVHAFRPRGADDDLPPHETLDEMIADYARALRKMQPEGPYFLGGWSTGGIYAFALAEELLRSGDEVALVAMFDTPLPSICDEVDVEDDAKFLCNLINFANAFAGTSARVNYPELLALPPAERFQFALAEARQQGTIPAEAPESFIRRLVQVGKANVRVIQGYTPQAIAAPTHLFLPTIAGGLAEVSGREFTEEGDHGWSTSVCQSLECHSVPGNHFSMMNGDSARQMARLLADLIASRDAVPGAAR